MSSSVEGIPVIVGQRVSSQGVVQMYGQNLKAIGSLNSSSRTINANSLL